MEDGGAEVKWRFIGRKKDNKKGKKEGIVGIYETPKSIAIAYALAVGSKITVRSYVLQQAEDLTAKQAVLQQFVTEQGLQGVHCSYVLSPGEYNLNLVDEPTVPKEEVAKALRWVLKDLVNFPVEDAILDTFELPFVRARDNTKMIYAATMRKEMIPKIEAFIAPSTLVLKFIDIPELVLKNVVGLHPQEAKGCAFLYLGPKSGRLILSRNQQLCITRAFELKADDLGKDPIRDAKILDALSLEIQRSNDYIGSVFRQNIPNVIILAPTLTNRNILQESFKSSLGSEVFLLRLSELLTFEKAVKEEEEAEALLAIGAVLRAWEKVA